MSTPWGAIAQGINETAGGIASSVLSRQASSQAWDRQKKVLKRQIQWRTADLRKAGLNPILAAGGGVGGGGASVAQSATPNLQGSKLGAAIEEGRRTNSKVDANKSQAQALDAAAEKSSADRDLALEKINTEKEAQAELRSRARAGAASARATEYSLPQLSRRADLWADPKTAPLMQLESPGSAAATAIQQLDRIPGSEDLGKSAMKFMRGMYNEYRGDPKQSTTQAPRKRTPRPPTHRSPNRGYSLPKGWNK